MFINDIVSCCKNVSIHLYADDAQVYLSRPIGLSEDLVCRINEDLCRINHWAESNGLRLNLSKTQALPISHNELNIDSLPKICINNTMVAYENTVTSLGFKLNQKLNCQDHINSVVCKMYAVVRKLWASSHFLPAETKLKVVKSLVVPIMSYSGLVYGNMDSASKQKLQLAINSAARYVFLQRKFDHISKYSERILNCDITNFFNVINLVFMHKLIYTQCPSYLYNKLTFARSSRTQNLIIPSFNYLVTSRTFFVSAIKLWNSLPPVIKTIQNQRLFKKAVCNLFS